MLIHFLSCIPSYTRLHLAGHSMVYSILQYSYCTEDKAMSCLWDTVVDKNLIFVYSRTKRFLMFKKFCFFNFSDCNLSPILIVELNWPREVK